MAPSYRSRNWVGTLNNPPDGACQSLLDTEGIKYICIGNEVGESGTPHLQMCFFFKNPKTLRAMKKINNEAHWETMQGTQHQAADYCKKDGMFEEAGELPMSSKQKGETEQERYAQAWDSAREGNIDDIPADLKLRFYGTLKRIKHDAMLEQTLVDTDSKMEWYYGASGTGKSRKAREENPDAYLKMCNKWWDGYEGEEVVLIEDFDLKHDCLIHHMKIWADRYPFLAEAKGSSMKIRPEKIIVTSNYHPKDIWTSEADLGPILRRFSVTRFGTI